MRADSDGPSVVGEVAFFMGISEPYTTAARLTGDVTLLVFAKTDYEELVENYPEQHDILVTNLLAHFELDKSGADMAIHKQVRAPFAGAPPSFRIESSCCMTAAAIQGLCS